MSRAGRIGVVAAVLAGVLALGAAVAGVGVWQGWFTDPTVEDARRVDLPDGAVTTLAGGLAVPWGIAFLPGGLTGAGGAELPDGSALVTERDTTRIVLVRPDGAVNEVGRVSQARPAGEGGLLGIAVSPRYATDGWVYVFYTAERDNRIARLRLGPAAGSSLPAEPATPILTGLPKAGNHNGGRIAFGPDGMLYAGTGDAARPENAQDRSNLGGKILRITPDGRPAPGNPFGDSPVYSMGHRNVQGIAWDAAGQLYAAEFGANRYDELNRIRAGGNYGWPEVEGVGGDSRFVEPVATWATSEASPSGIAVVGDQVWLTCLRGQRLYRIGTDGSAPAALLAGEYGRLRAIARAPDGSIWVGTSNRDGRGRTGGDDVILRITP